jgi:hypothetical protein
MLKRQTNNLDWFYSKLKKMKMNKIGLDLDFIGGQGSLTKTEEKELSDFFKSRKSSHGQL